MFGFDELVSMAASKQRIVFRGNFYAGYELVMAKRTAALWELVARARCGEMFTREEIVKAYDNAESPPEGWQQRLKIANGRNDEGAYHRMIQLGHDLFLVGKWDGQREIWFHDPYTLHGSVYGIERLPIEELVEGEDYHFEDEFYEFTGPGWNGEIDNPEPTKPAFDELPPRQQEFLLDLYWGRAVVKNGATRDALRRHGYITETDDWDAIELTQQGMTEVISKRNETLVMMCDPAPDDDDQPSSEVVFLRQERDEARAKVEHVQREYRRAFGLAWDNVLTEDMPRLMADEIILQRRNRDVEQDHINSLKATIDEQERLLTRIKQQSELTLELLDSLGLPGETPRRVFLDIITQVDAITQEQAHVEQV